MSDVRYICLPYCLQRRPDGRWILLNCRYKPIGFNTQDQVDYAAYPIALKLRITPAIAAKLSYHGEGIRRTGPADDVCETIHLYNDVCVPTSGSQHMQAYLARLAILAKVKVAP